MAAINHVRAFDYVRGIGSHMVVICHLLSLFLDKDQVSSSWIAITLYSVTRYLLMCFFIISGFVIAHSLLSYRNEKSGFDEYEFFVNRAARIYPPLLAALCLEVIVYAGIQVGMLTGYNFAFDYRLSFQSESYLLYPYTIMGSLLGFNGPLGFNFMPLNGPLWTLGYELWFYWIGMLAFSFWYGSDRGALRALIPIVLILGLVIARRNLNFLFLWMIWLYGFASYLLIYCSGLSRNKINIILNFGFFALVAVISLQIYRDLDFATPDDSRKGFFGQLAICLPLACLLAKSSFVLENNTGELYRKIGLVISQMSSHSYTLYVIHMPICVMANYLLGNYFVENGTGIILLIAVYLMIVFIADCASRFLEEAKRFRKKVKGGLMLFGIKKAN